MAAINITHPKYRLAIPTQDRTPLQVAGASAAVLEGMCLMVGMIMFLFIQPAMGFKMGEWDEPSKVVPFVLAHRAYFTVGGLFLAASALTVLPVVLGLHERLRTRFPALMSAATVLGALGTGLLFLNAVGQYAEFQAFSSLSTGVAEQAAAYASVAYDATNEAAAVCLGLWTMLLSLGVTRRGGIPRWLGFFGLIVGIGDLVMLFGLPFGQILSVIWYIAVGIALLRTPPAAAQERVQSAV